MLLMYSSKTVFPKHLSFRLNSPFIRLFSETQTPYLSDNKDDHKHQTYIKAGYITSVHLKSGDDISIVRPNNLKSIYISSDSLEQSSKVTNLDSLKVLQHPKQKDFIVVDNIKPVLNTTMNSFAEELMFYNFDALKLSFKQRLEVYSKLGKLRLTSLVVISTMAGSVMAPVSFDITIFALSSLGTFLTSMAANTANQILEVPYDSQMIRTRHRPLVLGKLSHLHASAFCGVCAISGLSLLLSCNPITFSLGLTNLILYTLIYTPLKRMSISNTWIGAVVGALPPLIGWSAATGSIQAGGLFIASMLFCWQFPHFMALSWNLRKDYSRAGYQMASMVSPDLCKRSALRHSVLITLICGAAPLVGLTDWCFVLESLPFNIVMCFLAYQFYYNGNGSTSRRLFRYTLVHLPILITLLILNKSYIPI